jgi:GNAT superfamily N-acetyltransferase
VHEPVDGSLVKIDAFSPPYAAAVKSLTISVLAEYAHSYDMALDADLDRMEEVYSGRARFWIALTDDQIVGTAAIREDHKDVARLKRTFLLPDYRGRGHSRGPLGDAVPPAPTCSKRSSFMCAPDSY